VVLEPHLMSSRIHVHFWDHFFFYSWVWVWVFINKRFKVSSYFLVSIACFLCGCLWCLPFVHF
jgi:hypothetical protein